MTGQSQRIPDKLAHRNEGQISPKKSDKDLNLLRFFWDFQIFRIFLEIYEIFDIFVEIFQISSFVLRFLLDFKIFMRVTMIFSTYFPLENKNILRTFQPPEGIKFKKTDPRPKFTGSYKK